MGVLSHGGWQAYVSLLRINNIQCVSSSLKNFMIKIFGPKREEDGSWRKLHNDELHDLYSSPNIVRVIRSRRMRWAGHVARMGRGEVLTGFWLGVPKARDHWEDLGVGGRIKLRWTLGRLGSMG
jgi:hypothetical protein